MKLRFPSKYLSTSSAFVVATGLLLTLLIYAGQERAYAAPITDFNAGNIISDAVFYNKNTMSVTQIQSFLDTLIPNCDIWGTSISEYGGGTRAEYAASRGWPGPPYPCLNVYYENPNTGETSYEKGGGAFAGGLSAAQIIYNAAQTYGINPQVLLVMLKKESAGPLTADSWPLKSQYKYSMGYACPDSGPNYSANCAADKAGFYKQMMLAAWQLNYYKEHPNDYRYKIGWNDIQYSTDPACGTKRVNIENMATLSLYIYTPYTPNEGALYNYPGTAPCGAYGNRNFFQFFKEWFGSPYFTPGEHAQVVYTSALGEPQMNEVCGIKNGGCYQFFRNGAVYWSPATGAHVIWGGIKQFWNKNGSEWGAYGLPTSGEIYGTDSTVSQNFENGTIYWNGTAYGIPNNAMNTAYKTYQSTLKIPTTSVMCGIKNGGCYQLFQDGAIYWSPSTGAHIAWGGIKQFWNKNGSEWGAYGLPTSGEIYTASGVEQNFEKGTIYWGNGGAYGISHAAINAEYRLFKTTLGAASSSVICGIKNNGCYQFFRNGAIYWSEATGAHAVWGGIKQFWNKNGSEWGAYGLPTSGEIYTASGVEQNFEKGTIYWGNGGAHGSL